MRMNILIGGKAGQGINKISEIVSNILIKNGYFVFNYRDYQSLIRGGHNFNILSISDKKVGSVESKLDILVALDNKTLEIHQQELKEDSIVISFEDFKERDKNLNVALAGRLIKILGIKKQELIDEIKVQFNDNLTTEIAEKNYDESKGKFNFEKLNNNLHKMTGSSAIAQGALNSKIDIYLAYPMTPATGVLNELAKCQIEDNVLVFQPENEIAVANAGLGASFSGAKTMIGTSGGGFDLMTEALSLQGITEIPLVVYLASRPGPATGIPTYTSQDDLNVALKSGHGEFPRIVIAPGTPSECIEKTNEAFYLSEKFGVLSIVLSDKHLAESEFSFNSSINDILDVEIKRNLPGQGIVKTSSYEHDELGNTIEDVESVTKNVQKRLKKTQIIKEECEKFEMIKLFGDKSSKNLVIGWGSTKTVILDSIEGLDVKFLQVLYLEPISEKIKKELEKAQNIILIENNSTGQLGSLIREKTGIEIKNKILKYDGRPFYSDKLREEIRGLL